MGIQHSHRAEETTPNDARARVAPQSRTEDATDRQDKTVRDGTLKSRVWPASNTSAQTSGEVTGRSRSTVVEETESPAATALPEVSAPSGRLMTIAAVGTLFGAIGSIMLAGDPTTRLLGVALGFFSGGLAVWRLLADDQKRAAQNIIQRDEKIRRLLDRCEALEDSTWELRESDERQASILSTLGDIVIRRDGASTVVYANTAAQAAFGSSLNPLIGFPLKLPRAEVSAEAQSRIAGQDEGDGGFGDVLLQTNRGPRWFSRIDISVRDTATEQPLIQTVLRDVTDRRMIENELLAARRSAESSSEAKSRFLATVSHEIRTPLNGILGMAALLRDTRLTKEQTAYIGALETSGETLLLLIDEVLDFSKVEAGKLELQPSPTPLATLAENVVELLAPKAQAKGLEIGTRIDPRLPDMVTVDATRVRQILFNLTGNGVKFTDEGGVSIEIDGHANPDGGCFLDITVRDTGIGFHKDEAERLFREFEQIDHGPARKFDGTGLGLAIAQRLAGLMKGTIFAEPGLDGGAVFRVSLPVPEPMKEQSVLQSSPSYGKKIVIVSNSRVETPLLAERLRSEGGIVSLCAPGSVHMQEQLSRAQLLLVDNSALPDSGAWLATARLAGCTAPAIVMVAPPERDRLDRLREAGFAAYLIRPVRMETLSQVISGLLRDDAGDHCWDVGNETAPAGKLRSLAPSRPLKLLVAEDNDINRLLSEALLRKLGHEPVMVVDGEKAVEAAAKEEFDAILMDLHMPGLDGIGAIRQIRERERAEGSPEVPILMVTADVMQDARDKAAAVGAEGYLTKPLSAEAISDALAALPKPTP